MGDLPSGTWLVQQDKVVEILRNPLQLDVVYNIGDAINKIGFGLVVYNLAVQSK